MYRSCLLVETVNYPKECIGNSLIMASRLHGILIYIENYRINLLNIEFVHNTLK